MVPEKVTRIVRSTMKFGRKIGMQFLIRNPMLKEENPIVARTISRYHVERLVRKVDCDTFIIEGESLFMRGTTDGTMADFEGGPFIERGMVGYEAGLPDNRKISHVFFMDSGKDNYGKVKVIMEDRN
jgi:hypothetical protein